MEASVAQGALRKPGFREGMLGGLIIGFALGCSALLLYARFMQPASDPYAANQEARLVYFTPNEATAMAKFKKLYADRHILVVVRPDDNHAIVITTDK